MKLAAILLIPMLALGQFDSKAPAPISRSTTNPTGNTCTATSNILVYAGAMYSCSGGAYAAVSAGAPTVDLTTATGVLPVNHGGTGTITPGLLPGTSTTVSGSWPNQAISAIIPPASAPGYPANQPVAGCGVSYVSGLTYVVGQCTYTISNTQYTSPLTSVTLSTASANDRIDIIGVNSAGAVFTRSGTAGTNPSEPTYDPSTELQLRFVYIQANATTPTNTGVTTIFDEGGNWTPTLGTGWASSTTTPCVGTTDVNVTNAALNTVGSFANGSTVDLGSFANLSFQIKSKAIWPSGNSGSTAQRTLTLQFYTGATAKGSPVVLSDGALGFNSSNTTSCQLVTVPASLFNANGIGVDTVKFTVSGKAGTSTLGFILDAITLQVGTSASSSTTTTTSQPFDVISTYVGKPAAGATIYAITVLHPVTFSANFTGSWANCAVANPTSTAAYTVKKNGSSVGTVSLSSSCVPTFTSTNGAAVTYSFKDLLSITAPNPQDATADTVAIGLLGAR